MQNRQPQLGLIGLKIIAPRAKSNTLNFDQPPAAGRDDKSGNDAEEDHELEANPAHPPSVQGSDGGRAQGETAGEDEASKTQR